MWLYKPVYEALPYYYLVAGILALVAAPYLDFWYWPHICLTTGFSCLVAGLVVWLKRRSYRQHLAESDAEEVVAEVAAEGPSGHPAPGHPHEV